MVHGGERFSVSVLVDDDVLAAVEEVSPLAPPHNPPALATLAAARALLAGDPGRGVRRACSRPRRRLRRHLVAASPPELARGARERLERALAAHDLRLLGAVPYDRAFTSRACATSSRTLHPQVLSEGETGRRISAVSVFAQAVPGGPHVLAEGRLVVVPGDRSDDVMAACFAALNGTGLAALLLTAGVPPDPQVWERAATATGLPVLLTSTSTYDTPCRCTTSRSTCPPTTSSAPSR